MKCPVVLVALGALILAEIPNALAQDDQYVQIFSLIQQGDVLNNSQSAGPALAKYLEAQNRLRQFQKVYPDWNTGVVNFRLSYLADRIADLTPKTSNASTPAATGAAIPAAVAPVPAANPPSDFAEQVRALQSTIRQLQADNLVLEAKVREAFAAQPAAVDARELAKAEDQIRSLEKENALMRVTLARQQNLATPSADTNAVAQLTQQLEVANRQLAEQTERAKGLALEATALQAKLDHPGTAAAHAPTSTAASTALEESNRKLNEQIALSTRLARERDDLAARVNAVQSQNEMLSGLRAENEVLKKQLAQAAPNPAPGSPDDLKRRLTAAESRIAALESDTQILNLEKAALLSRIRTLTGSPAPASAAPMVASVSDSARVKELEKETASLQKQLQVARKDLDNRKGKTAANRIEVLNGQIDLLRARLGVYEAQSQPYSAEELALLKEPDAALPESGPKTAQHSVRELPSGTAAMVAEARRDFAAHDYQGAESIYTQILRKDEKNVYTLANLATIQLELNRLDDAEKHVDRALELAPDDAYSLLVRGEIKFREQKYQDSLDALSKAAKLDPQNAEVQNYLGLALSQEGQRKPAETAFRKAIELDPSYGSAHNNLAVFYATQRPPSPGLARWHYQKAVAAGFPPNPDLEKLLGNTATAGANP